MENGDAEEEDVNGGTILELKISLLYKIMMVREGCEKGAEMFTLVENATQERDIVSLYRCLSEDLYLPTLNSFVCRVEFLSSCFCPGNKLFGCSSGLPGSFISTSHACEISR